MSRTLSEKLGLQSSSPQTKGIWHRFRAHSKLVSYNVCECSTQYHTASLQLVFATWAKQQSCDAKDINKLSHVHAEYSAYNAETSQAWSWYYCDLLPICAQQMCLHTCHTDACMPSEAPCSFRKRSALAGTTAAHKCPAFASQQTLPVTSEAF